MNLELKKAIDQISKDKGLDRNMLIVTLEEAVRTSVLRRFSEDMDVEVRYNDNTGDIEVYQFKIVVEDGEVENEDTHIGITEARPQGRQGRAPGRRPQEGQGQERQEQASRPQRGRRHITARARPAVLSRGRKAASSSPARNGGFRPRPVHQEIYAALCGSRR